MRDKNTKQQEFTWNADRLMKCVCFGEWNVWALFSVLFRRMTGCPLRTVSILVEEGLARLDATQSVRVETPCGVYAGLKTPTADTVAVVSIVRAGEGSGATLPLLVTGRTSLFVIGRRYAVGSCPAFTPRCCRRQDSHPARRIRPPQTAKGQQPCALLNAAVFLTSMGASCGGYNSCSTPNSRPASRTKPA
jgi:hypothetical protein